jgi:hypothetical protein
MSRADDNFFDRGIFSLQGLLREYGTPRIGEADVMMASDLLLNQLLRLPLLLPSARSVIESHEWEEPFVLDYSRQTDILYLFADGIAEVYESVGRVGIVRCVDREAGRRFAHSLMMGLAVVSADTWTSATADLALMPFMGYEGVTKIWGASEVEAMIILRLETARQILVAFSPEIAAEGSSAEDHEISSTGIPAPRGKQPKSVQMLEADAVRDRVERRADLRVAAERKYESIHLLALKMGVDPRTLYNWFHGKTVKMSPRNQAALAGAMSMSLGDLPD